MIDYNVIALVGIVVLTMITLALIAGIFVYKFENLRFKNKTNIKTDLHDGKVDLNSSTNIDGNINAKEKDGKVLPTDPSSSKQKIK